MRNYNYNIYINGKVQIMNNKQELVWSVISKIPVLNKAQKYRIKTMLVKANDEELQKLIIELKKLPNMNLQQLTSLHKELQNMNEYPKCLDGNCPDCEKCKANNYPMCK